MKQITLTAFYLFLLIPTVNAQNKSNKITEFSQQAYAAWSQHQAMPQISKQIKSVNQKQAYDAQSLLIEMITKSDPQKEIAGFKAGLTSKAGQTKFNVASAVYGVLFNQAKTIASPKISLSKTQKLMLETEIGFVVNQNINSPIADIGHLKTLIESVMPVIELPDLAFSDLNQLTGVDIIATNVASNQYILGKNIKMPINFSLNDLVTSMSYGLDEPQTKILAGRGSDASGDQWTALLHLINHQIKSGYQLKKGQFLITGALGKMIPARKGRYNANFGSLGHISFEVTE